MTVRHLHVALLLCAVAACSKSPPKPDPAATFSPTSVGDAAPSFTVATLAGDSMRVGGPARQPVTLVNIWATWCGPCKAEFPELQALHTQFESRGLRVLAISIDTDGDGPVAASAKAMGATFAIGRDPADQVRGQFAAVGIPESWLVSADGRVLWRRSGVIPPGDVAVRAAIESALHTQSNQ